MARFVYPRVWLVHSVWRAGSTRARVEHWRLWHCYNDVNQPLRSYSFAKGNQTRDTSLCKGREKERLFAYTKGRKIKGIPKKFNFKYYFDKDDNILMWEKYLDQVLNCIQVALYKENIKIIISFYDNKLDDKTMDIYCIYKCK